MTVGCKLSKKDFLGHPSAITLNNIIYIYFTFIYTHLYFNSFMHLYIIIKCINIGYHSNARRSIGNWRKVNCATKQKTKFAICTGSIKRKTKKKRHRVIICLEVDIVKL